MIDWRDEGMLLAVRRHGETSAIVEVLTAAHGRHAGLVRGGAGRTLGPVLQPGAQLALDWHARLADHLGTFRVEPLRARAAGIMASREALAALNTVSALLVRLLPERAPDPDVYAATVGLADALADGDPRWPVRYAGWELALLGTLGFGLHLGHCAATGARDDLVWISPRSGHAVSGAAGAPWAGRMLPLPQFLIGRGPATIEAVREALDLTGWFLEHRVAPAYDLDGLPPARARLLRLIDGMALAPDQGDPDAASPVPLPLAVAGGG